MLCLPTPPLHLAPLLKVTPLEFCQDVQHKKITESPCVIVWHCLCDPAFSPFSKTPTWDGRTDDRKRKIEKEAQLR